MSELSAEDQKLVTLAKGARARINAKAGACVRDSDGRTYSGAAVSFSGHEFGALELAIATALAAGTTKLEAVCVLGEEKLSLDDLKTILKDSGNIIVCDAQGVVISVTN